MRYQSTNAKLITSVTLLCGMVLLPLGDLHAEGAPPATRPTQPEAARSGASKTPTCVPTKAACEALAKRAEAVKKKAAPPKKPKHWFPKLTLGASMSMVHNRNVPGVDDGLNLTLGILVNGELKYVRGRHQWVTTLKLVYTQSKTPTVTPFIKTADELDVKSLYVHDFKRFHDLQVYGGLQLVATIFPGNLVPADDTALMKVDKDGARTPDVAFADEKYRLTPAFSPVILRQMAGVGITPSKDPMANLLIRLAFVSQEVWVKGYTPKDEGATPELELAELKNFQQVGPQLEVELAGKIQKKVDYAFRAELMFPVWTSLETDLQGFDLLNADISFKVGVKVSSWASLDYVFSAKRMPMIVPQWQVLNNLVLSLTANFL